MESQNLPSFFSWLMIAMIHVFILRLVHVCAPLESMISAVTAHGVK